MARSSCDLECKKPIILVLLAYTVIVYLVVQWNKTSHTSLDGNFSHYQTEVSLGIQRALSLLKSPLDAGNQTSVDTVLDFMKSSLSGDTFQAPSAITNFDVHEEDTAFGHTGEVLGANDGGRSHRDVNGDVTHPRIAVGGGLTSKGLFNVRASNMRKNFVFFSMFLPSFCRTVTAASGFAYNFYFTYDYNDPVFTNAELRQAFKTTFRRLVGELCPRGLPASIHLIQCSHVSKPAWAQNDAMLEAYLDDAEYYYRINDDTLFETPGWTETFVEVLENYYPPRIGITCPNHPGGNTDICTYDFVHRTHVDVFGFYYPRLFTDWWGDDWITRVYQPYRSTKLQHIHVTHTMSMGTRYEVKRNLASDLEEQLQIDIRSLNR